MELSESQHSFSPSPKLLVLPFELLLPVLIFSDRLPIYQYMSAHIPDLLRSSLSKKTKVRVGSFVFMDGEGKLIDGAKQ